MSAPKNVVLIGAGQTSASAARTLRREGYDGGIVIVGDEAHAPYQRPPLSKEFFVGESAADELWSAPPAWYEENDVRLELGKHVARIDRASLDVELADGSKIPADAVLIATGGRARRFPGAEGDNIFYLRTLEDAERMREKTKAGSRVVIVGGGFIGLEVAASARQLGADVTLIEALEAPLERVLGQEVGTVLGAIHREQGVDLRCDTEVESITDTGSGVVVRTSDGDVEGDIAVIGIGIEPNVEIAKASEITVGNGIRVDEFCRSAAEGIYAAGDVANHYHPLYDRRMRVEHFDNATRQGAVAAKNMLGNRVRHDDPHWFWSDQYDHSLQYAGHAAKWDDIIVRGSVDERDFVAFYLVNGRIAGAFGLNRGGDIMTVKSLLSARLDVPRNTLSDDDVDLEEYLAEQAAAKAPPPVEDSADDTIPDDGSFVRAARSGQVPEGIVRRFVVDGTEIAIARLGGKAYALHNLCTHLACHLSSGKVDQGGLTCLCHGSIFDLKTGEPINPPASRPVKTYPVREADGKIFVSTK